MARTEHERIIAGDGFDLKAIRSRVELVAEALDLRAREIDRAMSDPENQSLIEFGCRHGLNNWLIAGEWRCVMRGHWWKWRGLVGY